MAAPTVILNIRLPRELATELTLVPKQIGQGKSYHARQAIAGFLKGRANNFRAIAALERKKPHQT